MDLHVLFDPQLEIAALVDMEAGRGLGPVGVGPNARGEMLQFVALMPEATYNLSSYDLARAYMQFWQREFAALYETPPAPPEPEVVTDNGASGDAARLAEAEASATGDGPPPAQPADTDMDAEAETPPYVGPCFACQGRGTVPGAEEGQAATCNLCKGTGQLPAEAAAT